MSPPTRRSGPVSGENGAAPPADSYDAHDAEDQGTTEVDAELLDAVSRAVDRLVRVGKRANCGALPMLGGDFVRAPWGAQIAALALRGEAFYLLEQLGALTTPPPGGDRA